MDKKSKKLLIILVIIMITSIGYTLYKTLIKQDFEIITEDPISEEIIYEME